MSYELKIIISLLIIIIFLIFILRRVLLRLSEVKFQKSSLSSKYGKMTEQFLPFLADYPYDPQNFRFIGTPIDGVQFEENQIIFLEFKTANSRLSPRQQNIRDLVENKSVSFEKIQLK